MPKNVSKEKIVKNFENKRHQFAVGVIIGLIFVVATFILQCVALFTPHWKEISTNAATLYVDGVDALIRTEVLHYFNSVHRSRRHSYGLFHRCEYFDVKNSTTTNERKRCTKNYLPSYREEDFNECHSLPYYRFCIKANEKNFDIAQDYLRAAFDVPTVVRKPSAPSPSPSSSCDCQYPTYVVACQIIGIFSLIFLIGLAIVFLLFLFVRDVHYRLKLKCFGILFGLFASVSMFILLIITSQHFSYESIEYLIAIERHYKITQIYKLSQDTKLAIDRFLKTIDIAVGYSSIIAWIAFSSSIIDLIFFISTCKISHEHREDEIVESPTMFKAYPSADDQSESTTPLKSEEIQDIRTRPPTPPPRLPVMEETTETSSFSTNVTRDSQRRSLAPTFAVEDEV